MQERMGSGGSMSGPTGQWDAYAEQLRAKLPAAPVGLVDGYVRFMPWIAIVFGVLGVLVSLAGLGLGAILGPIAMLGGVSGMQAGLAVLAAAAIGLVGSALEVVGGYLMLKRSLTGWWLLALGLIIGAVSALLNFSIFGVLLNLLIGYIHLQAKPRYS
jgi:hypothetical protein